MFISRCTTRCSPNYLLKSKNDGSLEIEMDESENHSIEKFKILFQDGLVTENRNFVMQGLDSLFYKLSETKNLTQISIVSEYLSSILENNQTFIWQGKTKKFDEYKNAIDASIRSLTSSCSRLRHLQKVLSNGLLKINGSERSTVARTAHMRCLYICDFILDRLRGKTLDHYLYGLEQPRVVDFENYFEMNCNNN